MAPEGLAKLATCNLNQWAMDFEGNLQRIEESIKEAKAAGCTFRCGPELEITGYGCEDSFLELDTFEHAWESLHELLDGDAAKERQRDAARNPPKGTGYSLEVLTDELVGRRKRPMMRSEHV